MKLTSLVDDLAERLRPGRNAHFVVVPRLKLVYGRVPKVANTAIRGLLAEHVEVLPGAPPPNKDGFWAGAGTRDAAIVSGAAVLDRYADHFVFTVVRHPYDRLVSCWSDMVRAPKVFLPNMARLGFRPGMTFAEFLDRVEATPDGRADLHFRSQAALLCARGRLVPGFVGRYDRLDEDWQRIRAEVADRAGTDLGPLPKKNVRREDRTDVLDHFADPGLVALVRRRFAEDFRLFFPDEPMPFAGRRVERPRPGPRRA